MKLKYCLCATIALAVAVFCASPAFSEETVQLKKERRTPVIVEYEGNDSIGNALFTRLKAAVDSGNPASPSREAKFRILLSTTSEFPSRPGVGSIYSAVWTLSMSEGAMEYYLVRDLGVVTPDTLEEVVSRIMGRTEGVSARYGYLDREKQ